MDYRRFSPFSVVIQTLQWIIIIFPINIAMDVIIFPINIPRPIVVGWILYKFFKSLFFLVKSPFGLHPPILQTQHSLSLCITFITNDLGSIRGLKRGLEVIAILASGKIW